MFFEGKDLEEPTFEVKTESTVFKTSKNKNKTHAGEDGKRKKHGKKKLILGEANIESLNDVEKKGKSNPDNPKNKLEITPVTTIVGGGGTSVVVDKKSETNTKGNTFEDTQTKACRSVVGNVIELKKGDAQRGDDDAGVDKVVGKLKMEKFVDLGNFTIFVSEKIGEHFGNSVNSNTAIRVHGTEKNGVKQKTVGNKGEVATRKFDS